MSNHTDNRSKTYFVQEEWILWLTFKPNLVFSRLSSNSALRSGSKRPITLVVNFTVYNDDMALFPTILI